jgi:hypothetical protein
MPNYVDDVNLSINLLTFLKGSKIPTLSIRVVDGSRMTVCNCDLQTMKCYPTYRTLKRKSCDSTLVAHAPATRDRTDWYLVSPATRDRQNTNARTRTALGNQGNNSYMAVSRRKI